MTSAEHEVINAMERYGGSFVKALAKAFLSADNSNFAKLKAAFPEYYLEYAEMVEKQLKAEIESLQAI